MAMVVGSIMSTVIAGPVFAVLFLKEKEAYACSDQALEHMPPDKELRMLACVHGARGAPAMLSLLELLATAPRAQPTIHVLHLFDADRKHVGAKRYHQRVQDSDKHIDRRIDDATQVNWAVDVFTSFTGLSIRQVDVGDRRPRRREEREEHPPLHGGRPRGAPAGAVPQGAALRRKDGLPARRPVPAQPRGARACPVHRRHLRRPPVLERWRQLPAADQDINKRGDDGGEEPRRPEGGDPDSRHLPRGSRRREAVAFACRLAKNDAVRLTVIRLVLGVVTQDIANDDHRIPTTSADHIGSYDDGGEEEVLSIVVHDDDPDERCVSELRREYVAKERAEYVERAVSGPMGVAEALRGTAGTFALVVVGRGGRQPPELVVGLEGWVQIEFPEVGPVGEILASDESLEMGSVLVVQQRTAPPPPFHLDIPPAI